MVRDSYYCWMCSYFLVVIFLLAPYVLLVRVMRKHRKNATHQHILEQVDHSVNKVASRVVIAIVCLYTPYVIMMMVRYSTVMNSPLRRYQLFCLVSLMCDQLAYVNFFVNSVIFISTNSACREQIKSLVNQFTKSSGARSDTAAGQPAVIELAD